MTATPTPGDLSARHWDAIRALLTDYKAALGIIAKHEGPVASKISKEAEEAIAALSALPAAGEKWEADGIKEALQLGRLKGHEVFYTTPQPSAAEEGWGPSYKQPWQAQADAAVGAQGEAVAWMEPKSIKHLAKQNGVAKVEAWNCASGSDRVPLYTHPAPAAGKGVDDLARIGELIRTQDNRITDSPIFIVQQKRVHVADPDYDNDGIVWVNDDHQEADEAEHARLEAAFDGEEPDGWRRLAVRHEWEFVTACFTEQGCKDYIARDGHNLKEPRIYASGSYRNEEWKTVRNFLAALTRQPVAGDGYSRHTLYDHRDNVYQAAEKAGPKLYYALKRLLDAVEERQDQCGIESNTIVDAHNALLAAAPAATPTDGGEG